VRSFVAAAKSSLALDLANFERGFALRCSIGVAIPLVVATAMGQPAFGVSAALGALSTGFASQQGVYRTRAAAMLATACGMSLSMLVGGYAAHSNVALVIAVAAWGYAYGLICSLGPAATAVGLNSVVALVIADAFSGSSVSGVPLQALLVLAGGIEQTLLLVIVWPTRRYSVERHALGNAYRALGHFANEIGSGTIAAPHPNIIASVRETLADPAPFARRGDIAAFQALLDEAERVRASLGGLVTDRYRYERRNDSERIDRLRALGTAVAPVLEELADALHEARAPNRSAAAWTQAEDAARDLDTLPGYIGKHARMQAQALLGQLRTAHRIASAPARERAAGPPSAKRRPLIPPIEQTWATLLANLSFDSPFGRHAVRLAVTLGAAMALALAVPIARGYWIAMTAALVLRPDFRTTFTRGLARIIGTVLGAIVATAIVAGLHPSLHLDVVLAIVFAALGYFVFGLNYGVYSLTVTAYVVFLLALTGTVQEHDAVLERSVATLLGAGLAALAYVLWPTWESERARLALAEQLDAYRCYCAAILRAYIDPEELDRKRLRDLQRRAWQTRAKAEASVDMTIAEPARTRAIAPRTALGVLAAQQRLGLALLVLNAYVESAARRPRPELEPLASDIDAAWVRCVAALRGEPVGTAPALRDRYRETEARFGEDDADAAVILAECDLLVDGLNTIAELLDRPSARTAGARRAERRL
jgi:uncharacterized membrane protein YccC